MPLWSANSTVHKAPTWVKPTTNADEPTNVYLDKRGWILRHNKGGGRYWEEVLATAPGALTAAGTALVNGVFFGNLATSYVQNNAGASVVVTFDEDVTVTGSPTLNVVGGTTNATATYSAGSGTNRLVFTFTVPAVTQTLSIPAQTIALNGGTVPNANLTFASGAVKNLQSKSTGSATVAVA